MLQWHPRLIALLVFALVIASFVGLGSGRGFSWR
jgi:hypothetical protein